MRPISPYGRPDRHPHHQTIIESFIHQCAVTSSYTSHWQTVPAPPPIASSGRTSAYSCMAGGYSSSPTPSPNSLRSSPPPLLSFHTTALPSTTTTTTTTININTNININPRPTPHLLLPSPRSCCHPPCILITPLRNNTRYEPGIKGKRRRKKITRFRKVLVFRIRDLEVWEGTVEDKLKREQEQGGEVGRD
ncbi:rho GTPase-activating protein 35 [Lates japonicus]|uniref:Rho GTPase-activating protein 35 n=1 Tax=Lates japonicus TaxID=270547 RepID=A0AAD3R6Z0_LATJO|nr:rho GTPase-activating protein 35 [Lates japonicus]